MDNLLKGKKLLVVEDDPGICDLLESFFLGSGAEVELVQNGSLAVECILNRSLDLILLDVVLPGQDGFSILGEIRESGVQTPVIMLTDQAGIDDKVRGLSTGADDYVTKPFSTRELAARATSIFRRLQSMENQNSAEVAIGGIRLQTGARELLLAGGGRLEFTKTEFDLFAYLALRLNQVVTHAALLEEVMGYRGDVETKALVMHVANIRRKLVKSEIVDVKIETVAGVGYKLVVIGDQ